MSRNDELSDHDELFIDELDMEMDEDDLLNVDDENEDELIKQMSLLTPSETLLMSPSSPNDSTLGKMLEGPTMPVKVEPKEIMREDTELTQVHEEVLQPVKEVITSVQPQQDALENGRKDVIELDVRPVISFDKNSLTKNSRLLDSVATKQSKRHISTSTSLMSSSKASNSMKRRYKRRNIFNKMSRKFNRQNSGLQSLMSINIMPPTYGFSYIQPKIEPLMNIPMQMTPWNRANNIPFNIRAQSNTKKVPFIIQAQSIGPTIARTVTVNPDFEGFSNPFSRNTRQSIDSTSLTTALRSRNAVVNERGSITVRVDF